MMSLFRQYIIGGDTGSREGAWFVFCVVMILVFGVAVAEFFGREMPETFALLTVVVPFVLTKLFLALGLKRAERAGWIENKNADSGER